ncbi:MAG: DnaA regulatory inactivator Hda [Pseudomonadota bacterium]
MNTVAESRLTIEPGRQIPLPVQLDVEARFETFFAGENAEIIATLQALPSPGVWLSGAAGSGRTHLLQATVAAKPAGHAMYLPLRNGFPPQVLDELPAEILLCLDDIDAIVGDLEWERALLLHYERVVRGGNAMVIAGSDVPSGTAFALQDLRSRTQSLLAFRLRELEDEQKHAALRMRAEHRGMELPDETARYLLTRLPRDSRTLYDWLYRLDEASLSAKRRLTVPFAREVLKRAGIDH